MENDGLLVSTKTTVDGRVLRTYTATDAGVVALRDGQRAVRELADEILPTGSSDRKPGNTVTRSDPALVRRLGLGDAVVIGLGSMIGAGSLLGIRTRGRMAGSALLVGLALAAGVAYCNAVVVGAACCPYPNSGGTYVYGRERLGEWWGFAPGGRS